MSFALKTTAFAAGEIPKKYTCDDADVSPELNWNAPLGEPAYVI
jgi:phosphatidylethanolamine-binding protein (PEBP) family uncharacterized protein